MPFIPFHMLASGMRLKEDLYNNSGLKLLPKGTSISDNLIEYLKRWDLQTISIENNMEVIYSNIPDESGQITRDREYDNRYISSTEKVVQFIDGLRGCSKLKLDEIRSVVDEIMQYTDIYRTMDTINRLRQEDKYTYQHCINVSIYSMFIGKWLNLEKSALKKLSYSALLHDIGKERISKNIIQKPGKLTNAEYTEIKKHPIYGYELIRSNTKFSLDIAMGVLQHHEKEDGSGYPLGLSGKSIHLFGKIIAVADIFDAMTSERAYKGKQSPFRTAEQLQENSFGELDPYIVTTFIRKLADFYIGSTVVLNTGEVGQIIMKIPTSPTRPLIKSNEKYIDLSRNSDLFIQDVLSI